MKIVTVSLLIMLLTIVGCSNYRKKTDVNPFISQVVHPEWSKNAVLYEVNVRQYTKEGTFNAFAEHLPRLKSMGIDVLWIMPSFPIGVVKRLGKLGSYYAVKDYMGVNPEFGTLDDLKALIKKVHDLGMHIILDWVPSYTAWDNQLAVDHPDWYLKDSTGNFRIPMTTNWSDVIQLDWSKKGLQDYMVEALKYRVNMGVDGFRVDWPPYIPKEFFERVRTELNAIKPILLLAENEKNTGFLEKGFDMNYSWELFELMNSIAQGKDSVNSLSKYFDKEKSIYPSNVYRMRFLTNHDENTWTGTIDSLMGDAQKVFATLIFTANGMPLIYSGQEVCFNKRLKFFDKDQINWDTCKLTGFYKNLIFLKKHNKAIWNGNFGGEMIKINTNKDNQVFSFYREKDGNRVVVFLNLSKNYVSVKPYLKNLEGEYTDYSTGEKTTLSFNDLLSLDPWSYQILVK
jgi:glycosidase